MEQFGRVGVLALNTQEDVEGGGTRWRDRHWRRLYGKGLSVGWRSEFQHDPTKSVWVLFWCPFGLVISFSYHHLCFFAKEQRGRRRFRFKTGSTAEAIY